MYRRRADIEHVQWQKGFFKICLWKSNFFQKISSVYLTVLNLEDTKKWILTRMKKVVVRKTETYSELL